MIQKLILYFDTIKRIPLKQNIFLLKDKVIRKAIPIRISSFLEIEKEYYIEEIVSVFNKNLLKLKEKQSNKSFWDCGISENKFRHHYHLFVNKVLEEYKKQEDIKVLKKLWEAEHDDIEFIYNLQRMYKFKEIMDILNFTDSQKLNVIHSWIDYYPPQKGASWMGFNCAIRLINWIKILNSINNIYSLKEKYVKTIFLSILQNIEFITKNIEYHIPGNHVVFQYFSVWLTLFLIGDKKSEVYSKLFTDEFENEFLHSGLHFELSTHYHLQVLQLGVYYFLIVKPRKKEELWEKIKKAYSILDSFSFSENNLPLIGDNCYNFFHNNLVEDSKNLNYLRKHLNFTEAVQNEINDIEGEYLILNRKKSKLIFDVGNIGMRQNPGHGHSDILSVNFSYDGIPIFIDPGTKRYSNLPENLELKRARSHNTISINGEDQSKLWGFFRWAFLPNATIYSYKKTKNSVILNANFRGFKNIGGAKHYRKVEINDIELIISDMVECDISNKIEQTFVLSEFVKFGKEERKNCLSINNYKFEFSVDSAEPYSLEVVPQKIYKSYDNHVDSCKIKIIYDTSAKKIETNIKLKLVNEKN